MWAPGEPGSKPGRSTPPPGLRSQPSEGRTQQGYLMVREHLDCKRLPLHGLYFFQQWNENTNTIQLCNLCEMWRTMVDGTNKQLHFAKSTLMLSAKWRHPWIDHTLMFSSPECPKASQTLPWLKSWSLCNSTWKVHCRTSTLGSRLAAAQRPRCLFILLSSRRGMEWKPSMQANSDVIGTARPCLCFHYKEHLACLVYKSRPNIRSFIWRCCQSSPS